MAKPRIKNPGAVVVKRLIKAVQNLESEEGSVGGTIKIASAADFTNLKTFVKKFKEECNLAHEQTLSDLSPEIELALTQAMNAKVYDWAYGDGDIVDTGQLRDSVDVVSTADSIMINYSAMSSGDGTDYAAAVYYGAYIYPYGNPSIRIYMPERPWIKHVLVGGYPGIQKFPLTERYIHHFTKNLKILVPELE